MVPRLELNPDSFCQQLGFGDPEIQPLSAEAGPGLFESYRIRFDPPHRDRILYVFPYDDPGWAVRIRAVLDFEQAAWLAFWSWVGSQEPDSEQVLPFVPLLTPATEAVRQIEVRVDDRGLPGFIRPMIDWPSIEHTPGGDEAKRMHSGGGHWAGLDQLLDTVYGQVPRARDKLDLARLERLRPWHLLSDGTHVVPTQFRLFHRDFGKLITW